VVSTPFILNRSGDVLNNYSGVSIKQKIPLRMYMGYSRTTTKWITINKIFHLDMSEYQFIESNAVEYAPYFWDINKELERKYAKFLSEGEWFQITILSELPRGVGLGFGSIVALLLWMIIQKIVGNGHIDAQINELKKMDITEVLDDEKNSFHTIMVDALKFDRSIYGMISTGTKMATFFDGYYPVVSFSEDGEKGLLAESDIVKRCYGFRLNYLFKGLRENPYLPIDYGIIYSGKPVLLEQIAGNKYKTNSTINKTIISDFKKMFGDLFSNMHTNRMPGFYKHLVAPETDEFAMTYGKIMGVLSMKILYYMAKIHSEAYEEDHMVQFLETLRMYRQADCVTRRSSKNYLKFIKSLLDNYTGPQWYIGLSPNDSTIMGGCMTFAMPLEGFRKMIVEAAEKTSLEFVGSKIIYMNWVDGVEYEGLKIEQDLDQGKYSEFLDSSSCILKKGDGKVQLGQCERMITTHKQWILLDLLNNKMYIHGRKLTSEDLHSQTATVDILRILIENIGKEVSNKELPVSSYSKNKNDMQGKIIIPLLELIEKEIGKRLPLVCKWSIYDFYLKLNPSDIDIAVIDKLDHQKNK
jgi:hypothetical protein